MSNTYYNPIAEEKLGRIEQVDRVGHKEYSLVVIKDIEMSFGNMVVFMIKWVLASIPAALILFVIFIFFGAFLSALLGIHVR